MMCLKLIPPNVVFVWYKPPNIHVYYTI